ncbi:MAG: nucleotidyltransferase domain-containing protein [Candidatus Omnitrophota bacterium]
MKGKYTKTSDIDMVVEFIRPIGLRFMDLAEYLEKRLGRKTDILTADGIKSIRIKKGCPGY